MCASLDGIVEVEARPAYSLGEIADWQLKGTSGDVTIPDLQRGFVWKPYQTEGLWDSLLRRFPVGTFVLAPRHKDGSNRFELLDGQQRATAIAFGFYDPWKDDPAHQSPWWRIRNVADIPILWLDLRKSDTNAGIRFVFRLLTRSQPWGYERKDNQAPLTAADRCKFLSSLDEGLSREDAGKRYLELPLTQFWPWDASLPVPFAFLLESLECRDWKQHISSLCDQHFRNLKTKYRPNESFMDRLQKFLAGPEAEEVRARISRAIRLTRVPVLEVPREVLEDNNARSARRASNDDGDGVPDAIETLFIRINSGGTPLAGEELIYSIYKSIFPETIKLVEIAGGNFVFPSRLVSLATRIVQADMQREGEARRRRSRTDGISLPTRVRRVRDFQALIAKPKFKERLQRLISSLADDNIFEHAQRVLCGSETFQLPSALAVDLARHSPEVLFLLVYRLHMGDEIVARSEEHRRVLGFLTALSWFGRGERLRDHDPCLRQVWRDLLTSKKNSFWRRSVLKKTIEPRADQLVMLPLLPPSKLSKFVDEWIIKKGREWSKLVDPPANSYILRWYKSHYKSQSTSTIAIDAWWYFLGKLRWQRGILLYAQRDFVDRWFPNFNHLGAQNLEDTNCPWDWDHIHAQKLIKRKWNVNAALREWHSTIGNLRIWPMELNRSDSDCPPSEKLGDPDAESNPFFHRYGLRSSDDILRASYIGDGETFGNIGEDCDIKNKGAARMIRQAILRRMVSLYRHWFDELRLAEYFPEYSRRHKSRD